jgi:hypothetical protein
VSPRDAFAARRSAALEGARGVLFERLPLKLAAIFLAFVLWLAVSVDEPGEQSVAVRVAVRAAGSRSLAEGAPAVSATVVGRRRDLLKLSGATLLVRRTIAAGAADSVRVLLRPADVELPAGMERDLRVRDVQPATVTLRFAAGGASASARALPAPIASAVAARATSGSARAATDSEETAGGGSAAAAFADTVWPPAGVASRATSRTSRAADTAADSAGARPPRRSEPARP